MKKISILSLTILGFVHFAFQIGTASPASAAELTRATSVFEDADVGSKQLLILKKGSHLEVTSLPEYRNGNQWSSVNVSGIKGWVESNTLQLGEGDVGLHAYPIENSFHRVSDGEASLSRFRYWLGLGPVLESTSGYSIYGTDYSGKAYGGATFALGSDFLLGSERRFIIQVKALFPWTAEVAQGNGAGRISRLEILPGFGYQIIPQTLEVFVHSGFTYIWGQSDSFDAKVAFTPGVSVSWTLSQATRGSLYQGLEFGIYRVEETRGAADSTGFEQGICEAFSPTDPTCTTGVAPAALQFILLYKIGGQH